MNIREILEGWVSGKFTQSTVLPLLETWELAEMERSNAFGITAENVSEAIEARANLWESIIQDIPSCFPLLKNDSLMSSQWLETLWKLWLPLAMQLIAERKRLGRPLVQGILGGQGTGKTTLATVLKLILFKLNYKMVSLSLDDLYKTYAERKRLREEDPRLIWRGPPGTHDLDLGIKVLDKLRQFQDREEKIEQPKLIEIPRFDKSCWGGAGDRTKPEKVDDIDIILFEGWFVGVRPIDEGFFKFPPSPIVTEKDRQFARDMNRKLQDYLPLWDRCDRLMVLYPIDYRLSKQWRRQAEQETIAIGKSGMTDREINQFVEYFWKALHPELFIKSMVSNSEWVDLVVEINLDRSVGKIYRPGRGKI